MIRSGQICPSLKKTPRWNQHIHVSLPRGFYVTASHWTSWWGRFMRWILIQLLRKWTFVSPKPVQWPFYFGDKGLSRLKMDHPSAGSKSTESSWSFKHMRCTRNISSFTWNISEPKHKLPSWKNLQSQCVLTNVSHLMRQ